MQSNLYEANSGEMWDGRRAPGAFLPRIARADAARHAPLPIADMADLFGITHRTLHFYEEKGLIAAQRLGTMRVYDAENIRKMAVICACREIGISLAAIQDLMEELAQTRSQEEAETLFHGALKARRREITSDLSSMNRQILQIRTLMEETAEEPAQIHRPALSDLERKCLQLMAEGYRDGDLADRLGIDRASLAAMEVRLMEALDARNRSQATAKAMIIGLLPN